MDIIPHHITSPLKGNIKAQAIEDQIRHEQEVLKLVKDNLVMAQNRMKQQEYQHCNEREFEVGDWMFVTLQPYQQIVMLA